MDPTLSPCYHHMRGLRFPQPRLDALPESARVRRRLPRCPTFPTCNSMSSRRCRAMVNITRSCRFEHPSQHAGYTFPTVLAPVLSGSTGLFVHLDFGVVWIRFARQRGGFKTFTSLHAAHLDHPRRVQCAYAPFRRVIRPFSSLDELPSMSPSSGPIIQ